jgi:hypothetical protein
VVPLSLVPAVVDAVSRSKESRWSTVCVGLMVLAMILMSRAPWKVGSVKAR